MIVDVIILSNTATEKHYNLLLNTINTLHNSEQNFQFNIILVESSSIPFHETESLCNVYINFKESFNYNKALNQAFSFAHSDYVVIANNDLEFEQGWFFQIQKLMISNNLGSACPFDPNWVGHQPVNKNNELLLGYDVRLHIVGWCIVATATTIKCLFPFDELFDFYFQDNDYAERLKKMRIKHGLITVSIVHHKLSQSQDLMSISQEEKYIQDKIIFKNKWPTRQEQFNRFFADCWKKMLGII
ncbi:MAG: glycosyltransferase, partial [Bacteroidetes bacterium]|nr:glycosyltransferase [Bacteroidota bacterium]